MNWETGNPLSQVVREQERESRAMSTCYIYKVAGVEVTNFAGFHYKWLF